MGITHASTMHVIMATSEMTPFAKTGGLGDVLGALPYVLRKRGHEVSVFIPYYSFIQGATNEFVLDSKLVLGSENVAYSVWVLSREQGVNIFGIKKEEFFDRSGIYGTATRAYEDNAARFIFFSKAVVDVIQTLGMSGIVHSHDWPTALIPVYLHSNRQHGRSPSLKSVFTIHNLGYQGIFSKRDFILSNLDHQYYSIQGLEYFGGMNCMKGGILFSNKVTTVSRQYAREIQTHIAGCGMEGVLQSRQSDLVGIVNGVDYSVWDPSKDRLIAENYDSKKMSGKSSCKKALLQKFNLQQHSPTKPVFGIVSRFVQEKGLDLILQIADEAIASGMQVTVLGNGDPRYEDAFKVLAKRYPENFGTVIGFNESLAHEIFAGSDFFLMPSLHEPCGLAQLYAMRYGSVPVVHAVGGLEDTVSEWNPGSGEGTGLKFHAPSATSLLEACRKAVQLFRNKREFAMIRKNAMKVDCSWDKSATEYELVYKELLN